MISVAVMAHRQREHWIPELLERIERPAEVVWDRVNDRHETGGRALEAFDPAATHHCVVQDDGLVCRDLVAGLERAVEVSGDRVLGLYIGNTRPRADEVGARLNQARRAGCPWLMGLHGPMWGVGIVIPTPRLPDLLACYRSSRETNYDRRISRWALRNKVECWYTLPSLVDHRSGGTNPSLVPGRTSPNRRARWFIGSDRSALDIDWAIPDTLNQDVLFVHRRTGEQRLVRAVDTARLARFDQARWWDRIVQEVRT